MGSDASALRTTATKEGDEYVINGVTVPAWHMLTATAPFNLSGLPALSMRPRHTARLAAPRKPAQMSD